MYTFIRVAFCDGMPENFPEMKAGVHTELFYLDFPSSNNTYYSMLMRGRDAMKGLHCFESYNIQWLDGHSRHLLGLQHRQRQALSIVLIEIAGDVWKPVVGRRFF